MTRRLEDIDRVVRDALLAETDAAFPDQRMRQRIVDVESQRQHRPRRARSYVSAAAMVLAALVGVGLLITTRDDPTPPAGPTDSGFPSTVPVPPVGEARPERLRDGAPVWVVHHHDGTVSVLDAVSAHEPFGLGQLVGWCATSRGFEDPQHGSQYDERGRNRGGPAPQPLGSFATEASDDETVTVTGPDSIRPAAPVTGVPAQGASCFGVDAEDPSAYDPGSLDLHPLAADPGVALSEALSASEGQVVVVRDASILLVAGRPSLVCHRTALEEQDRRASVPPRCDGPEALGVELTGDRRWAVAHGRFAVRIVDGAVRPVAFVAGWTLEERTGG